MLLGRCECVLLHVLAGPKGRGRSGQLGKGGGGCICSGYMQRRSQPAPNYRARSCYVALHRILEVLEHETRLTFAVTSVAY